MSVTSRCGFLVALALVSTTYACGGSGDDAAPEGSFETATDEQALGSAPAPGHYVLIQDSLELMGHWVDDLTLNADGSFLATLGTDIDNVASHEAVVGRWEFHTFVAGPSLVFKDPRGKVIREITFLKQFDGHLNCRTLNSDPSLRTKFGLKRG